MVSMALCKKSTQKPRLNGCLIAVSKLGENGGYNPNRLSCFKVDL